MRKFYLQNQAGARIDLNGGLMNGINGICLSDPSGIGTTFNNNYASMNDGFYSEVKSSEKQGAVSATLIFTQAPYTNYKLFADWIMAASTLYLIYAPENTEYYRQVSLSYLTKTEINIGVTWMEVPISFYCKTPWYKPAAIPVDFNDSSDGTKYTFIYNDDLRYFASASGTYSAELEKGGHLPAAVKVTYVGTITNPTFKIVGVSSGTLYGECDATVTLSNNTDSIELFTSYLNSYIKKTVNGVESNLIDSIDLTKNPFFHIPLTENVFLSLTASGAIAGTITAWVYYYYRTV